MAFRASAPTPIDNLGQTRSPMTAGSPLPLPLLSAQPRAPKVAFGRHMEEDKAPRTPVDDKFAWEKSPLEDTKTPYRLQGDATMNTRENLLKRNALRSDNRVKRAIQMFWDMVPKTPDLQIDKNNYIALLVRICKLVVPEFDLKDSLKTAESDWERDAKGGTSMGYRQFFDSFFELADIWCPDIDGGQYAHFLDTLRTRLTVMVVHRKDGSIMRKLVNAMKLSPSAAALAGSSTPEFLPAPIVDPYKSAAAKSKEVTVAAAPKQPPAKAGGIGAATSVASASGGAPGKPPAAPTTSAGLAMEPVTEVRRARQVPQSRIGAAGSRGQAASRRAPGTPPGSRQGGRRTPTRSSPVPPARGASPAPQARSSSPAPPVVSDIAPGEAEAAAVRLQSMARGKLARDKVQGMKAANKAGVPPADYEKAQAAAVRVQAGVRGHMDRKYVQSLKEQKRAAQPIAASSRLATPAKEPQPGLSKSESSGKFSSSDQARPLTPRPGDKLDSVSRPGHDEAAHRLGGAPTSLGKFVDVLAFDHSDLQEGDVVTMGFADLDEIYHCPDLIVEEDEEEEEDDSEDEGSIAAVEAKKAAAASIPITDTSSLAIALPASGSVTVSGLSQLRVPSKVTSVPPAESIVLRGSSQVGFDVPPPTSSSQLLFPPAGPSSFGSSPAVPGYAQATQVSAGARVPANLKSGTEGTEQANLIAAADADQQAFDFSVSTEHGDESAGPVRAEVFTIDSSSVGDEALPDVSTALVGLGSQRGDAPSSQRAGGNGSVSTGDRAGLGVVAGSRNASGDGSVSTADRASLGGAAGSRHADGDSGVSTGDQTVSGGMAGSQRAVRDDSVSTGDRAASGDAAGSQHAGGDGSVGTVDRAASGGVTDSRHASGDGSVRTGNRASSGGAVSSQRASGDGNVSTGDQASSGGVTDSRHASGDGRVSTGDQASYGGAAGTEHAGRDGSVSAGDQASSGGVTDSRHASGDGRVSTGDQASYGGAAGTEHAGRDGSVSTGDRAASGGAVSSQRASGDGSVSSGDRASSGGAVSSQRAIGDRSVSTAALDGLTADSKRAGGDGSVGAIDRTAYGDMASFQCPDDDSSVQAGDGVVSGGSQRAAGDKTTSGGAVSSQRAGGDAGMSTGDQVIFKEASGSHRAVGDGSVTTGDWTAGSDAGNVEVTLYDSGIPVSDDRAPASRRKKKKAPKDIVSPAATPVSIRDMIGARMRGRPAESPLGLLQSVSLKNMVSGRLKRLRGTEAAGSNDSARTGTPIRPSTSASDLLAEDSAGELSESGDDDAVPARVPMDALPIARPAHSNAVDPYLAADDLAAVAERADLQEPRVLIAGRPGAGKSLLAKRMADSLGVPVIGANTAITTALAAASTSSTGEHSSVWDLQHQISTALAAGAAAPVSAIAQLIALELLQAHAAQTGFVLDGFPLTSTEYSALDAALRDASSGAVSLDELMPSRVVHLDIGLEDLLIRAASASSSNRGPSQTSSERTDYEFDGKEDTDVGGDDATIPSESKLPDSKDTGSDAHASFASMTPEQQAVVLEAVRNNVQLYNSDSMVVDKHNHLVVDATQSPDNIFREVMGILGEGFPPLSRLPVPAAKAHAITVPDEVSIDRSAAIQFLLNAPVTGIPIVAATSTADSDDGSLHIPASFASPSTGQDAPLRTLRRLQDDIQKRQAAEIAQSNVRQLSSFGTKCPVTYADTGSVVEGSVVTAAEYQGQVYLFASAEAKDAFMKNPKRYIRVPPKAAPKTKVAVVSASLVDGSDVQSVVGAPLASVLGLPVVECGHFDTDIAHDRAKNIASSAAAVVGTSGLTAPISESGWLLANAPSSVAVWKDLIAQGLVPDTVVILQRQPEAQDALRRASLAACNVAGAATGKRAVAANSNDQELVDKATSSRSDAYGDAGASLVASAETAVTEGGTAAQDVGRIHSGADLTGSISAGEYKSEELDEVSDANAAVDSNATFDATSSAAGLPRATAELVRFLEAAGVKVSVINADSDSDAGLSACQQLLDPFAPSIDAQLGSDSASAVLGDMGRYCPVTSAESGVLVPGNSEFSSRVSGETFYFANAQSKIKFDKNPGLYLHLPTEAAVASGSIPSLDTPRTLPPPKVLVLAPEGSNIEQHLAKLSKALGVELLSVPALLQAHPKWASVAEQTAASMSAAASQGDGDSDGDSDNGIAVGPAVVGPGGFPTEAYTDVLRAAFKKSVWSAPKGTFLDGIAAHITPELATAMLQAAVPPSIVVPVTFDSEKLVAARLAAEFEWIPPTTAPASAAGDDGTAAPVLTTDEFAELESEARAAAKQRIAQSVEADKARLGAVEAVFEGAGVALASPVDFNGSNSDRVYARLLAALQPIISGKVQPIVTAAPIPASVAMSMLDAGTRRLSKFGPYCPVTLLESGDLLTSADHPVLYRRHVYMTASAAAANKFAANPALYVSQPAPPPAIPASCAIIGPDFSGKSSAAQAIADANGLTLVSVPRAIEAVLSAEAPDTALKRAVQAALGNGGLLSDELAAQAISHVIKSGTCSPRGWVLDGFPGTPAQAAALQAVGITPRTVFHLRVPDTDLYARAVRAADEEQQRLSLGIGAAVISQGGVPIKLAKRPKIKAASEQKLDDAGADAEAQDDGADGDDSNEADDAEEIPESNASNLEGNVVAVRPGDMATVSAKLQAGVISAATAARSAFTGAHYPSLTNGVPLSAIAARISTEQSNLRAVVDGYLDLYENVKSVDASSSKSRWAIGNSIAATVRDATRNARLYAGAIKNNQPAAIRDVTMSREEIEAKRSEFGTYCPVSWAAKKQLKDMAGTVDQRNFGVEYRGQLYFPAGLEEQRLFMSNPEQFLSGQSFPSASRLPVRLSPGDVAAHGASGAKLGLKGFCPVSLMENPESSQFVQGNDALPVLFHNRVFFMETEDKLRRFMQAPWFFAKQKLPAKAPPKLSRVAPQQLVEGRGSSGSIAYLEQTLSEMIIKALTAVEEHRSSLTHPALSIEGSCKAFVALYLKANNAAAEPHARQRAEARLKQFLEECTVSEKLRTAAARGSAVKAARQSPRVSSEVRQLGEQFDKLRSEPKPLLMRRYLRPEPVAFK